MLQGIESRNGHCVIAPKYFLETYHLARCVCNTGFTFFGGGGIYFGFALHHWTDNYYIASRYFPELIMSDVMQLYTSIMVCELICRQCNSGHDWLLAQCSEHQNYITSIAWELIIENEM